MNTSTETRFDTFHISAIDGNKKKLQRFKNHILYTYSKTCVKKHSKRPQIGFQDQLSLNAGQKECIMPQREHSAILSTFIKLPFVIKIFVLSIFEWPFFTGFTVCDYDMYNFCVLCELAYFCYLSGL